MESEEEKAQLEIINKAIEGCEALYMDDGIYVVPISLNGYVLRIMSKGVTSNVSILRHVFEEEF